MNDSSAESGVSEPQLTAKMLRRAERWCSQLLDLSRRNRLLNFRDGPHAVRIAADASAALEDDLSSATPFKILPMPSPRPEDTAYFADEALHHRLYADPGSGIAAYSRLLGLWRAARTDMEEGGSNTLFLALGVLRWKDGTGAKAPVHRAPLLLWPVSLAKLPVKAGFTIKRADEDAVSNVTLLEMLRREQHIEVAGVEPPPQDEHGVDLNAVLSAYAAAVRPLEGWEVLPELWIGRFSFNKFLMWKDLSARLSEIAKAPVVAHLMSGGGSFDDVATQVEPSDVDSFSARSQPLAPLAADSSQLSAVINAAAGRSFVLHGPPGTGKSQTITNLIANCLAEGKTVLFVAEKRAALEVVHRRLRKIGLSAFCLELHSNKAGKSEVLRQFSETLSFAAVPPPSTWQSALSRLREDREKLDAYVRAMHSLKPCGLTPHRAFSWALSRRDDPALANAPALPDAPLDDEAFARVTQVAEDLAAGARDVPEDLFEPLDPVGAIEWTPAWAEALAAAARPIPAVAQAVLAAAAAISLGWDEAEKKLLTREKGLAGIEKFERENPGFETRKALELDVKALRAKLESLPERFFVARFFARRAIRKAVKSALKPGATVSKPTDETLATFFNSVDSLRIANAEADVFAGIDSAAVANLVGKWEEWKKAISTFSVAASLRENVAPDKASACASAILENPLRLREWCRWSAARAAAEKNGLAPLAEALAEGSLRPSECVEALRLRYCERVARAALDEDATLRGFFGNGQDALVESFAAVDAQVAELSRRMVVAKLSSRLPTGRLGDCPASAQLAMLRHEIGKKTRQKPVRQLLEAMPDLLPMLKPCLLMSPLSVAQYLPPGSDHFDVVVFDEASQLTVWDAIGVLARGKQAVIVGDPMQLPPTSFFQKTDSADEEDVDAPDDDDSRDLESILDECKAAGMPEQHLDWHYRSRHESLIAFSNHNYYSDRLYTFPSAAAARAGLGVSRVKVEGGVYDRSRTRTNRKEAEAVVSAAVSRMLDPAFAGKTSGIVTFSMAQKSLIEDLLDEEQMRHPEIMRFFDDSLPEPFFVKNLENVQGDERDAIFFSIGYAPDESGSFAMNFGPLNRPGGERRLNVAVTRAREEVVVFTSIDSVQIDLSRTSALGAAHLRDFLAYAEAGERASAATSSGSASGSTTSAASPDAPGARFFERDVAECLRCHGYEVDELVGRSSYRVDLGIRRQGGDGYAVAVECDGDMYRSALSARDRDVSRSGVLSGLGWKSVRCWCLEWWFDREKAERKLLSAVEKAMAEPEPSVEKNSAPIAAPDFLSGADAPAAPALPGERAECVDDAASGGVAARASAAFQAASSAPDPREELYVRAPVEDSYARAQKNFNSTVGHVFIQPQMERIINAEGPITEGLLFKRVLAEWGWDRSSANRVAVLKKSLPKQFPTSKRLKETVFWSAGADPKSYDKFRVPPPGADAPPRAFDEIPVEEIASAMRSAASDAGGFDAISPEDIARSAAAKFGFSRISPNMKEALDAAFKRARSRHE